ncbi:hypothetical protein K502DRAFT_352728 [Neoconidiobolus thromboides FSU 785]|nr:hypothetical protein K502DRAFT_352728 [Neoconidiobolus thromboides FSU 785]
MTPELSISHKLLLQNIMLMKTLNIVQMSELYCRCFKQEYNHSEDYFDSISSVLHDINEAIFIVGFEIKKALDPISRAPFFCITNIVDDEMAQLGNNFTPIEMRYLKTLIHSIITAPRKKFFISGIEASKLALLPDEVQNNNNENNETNEEVVQTTDKLTIAEKDHLIDRFINETWLEKTSGGYLTLTMRTLLELQTNILDNYKDYIKKCMLCSTLVINGEICKDEDCDSWVHIGCIAHYHRASGKKGLELKCPKCKCKWEGTKVGYYDSTQANQINFNAEALL